MASRALASYIIGVNGTSGTIMDESWICHVSPFNKQIKLDPRQIELCSFVTPPSVASKPRSLSVNPARRLPCVATPALPSAVSL